MEGLKEYIYAVFEVFTKVTAWILLSAACFITVFWGTDEKISSAVLWQILGMALLCAVGATLLFGDTDRLTKRGMLFRSILCYIFVNAVVITGGICFEWFSVSNWKMVLVMLASIALGYLTVVIWGYVTAKRKAALMNKKLRERE